MRINIPITKKYLENLGTSSIEGLIYNIFLQGGV